MPIVFTCPECGLKTNVADQYAGQSGPCAGCGATITVPGGGSPVSQATAAPRKSSSAATTTVIILVVALGALVMCGGVAVALLLPATQSARGAAQRAQCGNNLKQIGIALHNYHDTYQSFPPAYIADANGKPMHSWRVLILPFLEQQPLYQRYNFNEPWDGPNNSQLRFAMPPAYACPSNVGQLGGVSSYAMVVGPGTLFDGPVGHTIAEVTDGTSNTLAVVEAGQAGLNWLEPKDLDLAQMTAVINGGGGEIGSSHPGAHRR